MDKDTESGLFAWDFEIVSVPRNGRIWQLPVPDNDLSEKKYNACKKKYVF